LRVSAHVEKLTDLAPEAAQGRHLAVGIRLGSPYNPPAGRCGVRPLLDSRVKSELEPFLRAMRRRLERDRNRVHGYHDDLRRASLKRLAALAGADGEKSEADRRRETIGLPPSSANTGQSSTIVAV
jgi:hypothetical protein